MKTGPKRIPVAIRLWRRVVKDAATGCWNWTGSTNDGYGMIGERTSDRKITHKTHRLSWELVKGTIPEGLQVLHRCDNRRCVNPEHLFLGTLRDNMADMVAKNRQARGAKVIPHNLAVGTRQPGAKLKEADIPIIREALAKGVTCKALAGAFGVCAMTIQKVRNGTGWRHA